LQGGGSSSALMLAAAESYSGCWLLLKGGILSTLAANWVMAA